jgi:type III secretion protein L
VTVLRGQDWQVWVSAQKALEAASEQADQIVREAQTQAEEMKRHGYQEGLDAAKLEAAERLVDNVAQQVEFFSRLESRMVDLVMDAVQTVVHGYDERERVWITVRNVLAVARSQTQVTLRVAPGAVSDLREGIDTLRAEFQGIGVIDIVADARLSGDACVLETEVGVVEASLAIQLKALRRAFDRVLGGGD